MSFTSQGRLTVPIHPTGVGGNLVEALTFAEQALSAHAGGQVDAVIGPRGQVYLLADAQQQLRRSEARLKELFASVPDTIVVLDGQGEILSLSPSIKTLLGHEAVALVGRAFMTFVHPEDRAALQQTFSDLADELIRHRVVRFRYRSKEESWLLLEAAVGLLPSSQSGRFIVNCRDATDPQRDAGAEHDTDAGASIRQMETSLAVLSHELRTPLTPVLLSLAMLRMDESLAQHASTFDMMERNLRMQLRLIDELKDLVQVGHQKLGLVLNPVDAHVAIGSVMEICAETIADRRIAVRMDLGASDFTVLADSLKLQQIIWNVLQNAIKFSEPGGAIFLKSRSSASGVFVMEVTDQGAGIESAFLPHVFEPFKQSSASTCRKSGSLGLGMYIARGLAEAQGGTLTVTSDGLGYGCTFRLSLRSARSDLPMTWPDLPTPIGPSRERLRDTFPSPTSTTHERQHDFRRPDDRRHASGER